MRFFERSSNFTAIPAASGILLAALLVWGWPIAHLAIKPVPLNPFGVEGSGIGRTISRLTTRSADITFHLGSYGFTFPRAQGIISRSVNRLYTLQYPEIPENLLSRQEITTALVSMERKLALAFAMDRAYPAAYQIFFDFLVEPPKVTDIGAGVGNMRADISPAEMSDRWRMAHKITAEALTSYDLRDPEEAVAAALAAYNQFSLFVPRRSACPPERYNRLAQKCISDMTRYLAAADEAVAAQSKTGQWGRRSVARQRDFQEAKQFVEGFLYYLKKTLNSPLPQTQ